MQDLLVMLIKLISAIDSARKTVIPAEELALIPPQRRVDKPAAAGLIVPKNWETYLNDLSELPILLGRSSRTGWLEVLGGGLQSAEETIMEKMFSGAIFPDLVDPKTKSPSKYGGAFYHLQAQSILAKGEFSRFSYNTKDGEHDQMAALREVVEEGVVDGVQIVMAFPETVNVGVRFSPFNANLRPLLEEKYPGMYDGSELWVQTVVQRGFLATVDCEHPEMPKFKQNAEIKELKWVPFKDLLLLAKAKAGVLSELPEHLKEEKLRNSVPLHFCKWFIERLCAEDTPFSLGADLS